VDLGTTLKGLEGIYYAGEAGDDTLQGRLAGKYGCSFYGGLHDTTMLRAGDTITEYLNE